MTIGAINIVQILEGSKRGQTLAKQLKAVADRWQAKATATEEKLTQAEKAMEMNRRDGSSEALFKVQRDAELLKMELRQIQQAAEFELNATRDHLRSRLLEEAQVHLKKLAEEKSLAIVVTVPSRELAFVAPSLDITEELIVRLDRAAPAEAAPTAQPGVQAQTRSRAEALRRS